MRLACVRNWCRCWSSPQQALDARRNCKKKNYNNKMLERPKKKKKAKSLFMKRYLWNNQKFEKKFFFLFIENSKWLDVFQQMKIYHNCMNNFNKASDTCENKRKTISWFMITVDLYILITRKIDDHELLRKAYSLLNMLFNRNCILYFIKLVSLDLCPVVGQTPLMG